jgi:ERF superfamily
MKVYKAIGAVSAALSHSGISKARKNQQQGYNFRGIDDVLNALSTALVEAGLVILPRCVDRATVERTTAKGGALFYVTCKVEFDLVSTEDGSKHTVCTYGEAMDSADKATNKAMSAAYKYLALLVFCIPTEATPEADADFSTHDVAPQDNAPSAFAGRLASGIAAGDAAGAALAFYGQEETYKKAVWTCLSAADKKAIAAHKTEGATA